MADFKAFKVVSSLPTLTANALYLVKLGSGWNLYATNDTGTLVAYPLQIAAANLSDASANGRSLVTAADYAAMRILLSALTGSLGATDNAILRADGTGGATAQGSLVTIDDNGKMSIVATAQAGAEADILKIAVSDATGYLSFQNGTSGNNGFSPLTLAVGTGVNPGYFFIAQIETDPAPGDTGSTNGCLIFRARNSSGAAIGTRPPIQFQNGPTTLLELAANGNARVLTGNVTIETIGKGIAIKEGANARMGLATLVGGTVTVANTSVTANTRIFHAVQTAGGTQGNLRTTRVAGTSFTITSTSATETSTVAWELKEPL